MSKIHYRIWEGGVYRDARGLLRHVNSFSFNTIRRFYLIHFTEAGDFRGWQYHRRERKYFYAAYGSVEVHWVVPKTCGGSVMLNAEESKVVELQPGCANGMQALEAGSVLLVFSDMELEDSQADMLRYPADYWPLQPRIDTLEDEA